MIRKLHAAQSWFEPLVWADDDVLRYVVKICLWARWVFWLYAVFLLAYRPSFWYPDKIEHLYLQAALLLLNGLVHYRFITNRPVTWRWMLALSALDIVLITGHVAIHGELDALIFLAYYPALGAFALVFASVWAGLVWTTIAAASYAGATTLMGAGLDIAAGDEKVLLSRLVTMYVIVLGAILIIRFERRGRQIAIARERRVQQERIELSQAIHDTTAQTAYMIGLGIHRATQLADTSNEELMAALDETAALSRSAMWELRRPIDSGLLFEGSGLARVLRSHCASFERITGVPAELVQSGPEPPLPTEMRSRLFSIGHNALTNALLHARPGRVVVGLEFEADRIRLSVSDDGVGLPDDYAERGRGFPGMNADAEALGGTLEVESGGGSVGTTITCVVPWDAGTGGA